MFVKEILIASASMGVRSTARKRAKKPCKRTADQLKRSNEELEQFALRRLARPSGAAASGHRLRATDRSQVQEPTRRRRRRVLPLHRRWRCAHAAVDCRPVLNYSRVGTRSEPFRSTNVQAVVDRALVNLTPFIEDAKAVVTCDSLPTIRGDEAQLVQLFQNLIGNGVKFRADRTPRNFTYPHPATAMAGSSPSATTASASIKQYWDADLRDLSAAAQTAGLPWNRYWTGDLANASSNATAAELAGIRTRPRNNLSLHPFS